jgi:hypothetical protein
MGLEAVGQLQHERLEVFQEHAVCPQEPVQRLVVPEREMSLEEQPIEARERSRGRRRVLREELLHSSPPCV